MPSASGSAYLELQPDEVPGIKSGTLIPPSSSLKLTCTVHGPKPLPRSAPFSPNLLLSTHVKFAPFAARRRRGYLRDVSERDLGAHLETALRGMIIGDRWPKSGLDVSVTVIEGEDDRWWGDTLSSGPFSGMDGWGLMNVLSGCITVASAAIADSKIDCLDLIAGGVAAFVKPRGVVADAEENGIKPVLDPNPAEHQEISSACVVGYMPSRDEITELWLKGDSPAQNTSGQKHGDGGHELLIDGATEAARAVQTVLLEAAKESAGRFTHRAEHPVSASCSEVQI